MRTKRILAFIIGFTLFMAGAVWAAIDTKTLTINATVSTKAELSLSQATINFPDADPDTTASIPADSPVTITAKVKTGLSAKPTLTVKTATDLTSGMDTIAITNVTWTATGDMVDGTMSKDNQVTVNGNWTGSNKYVGTCSFFLANSWTYAVGNYTAVATYTLTSP